MNPEDTIDRMIGFVMDELRDDVGAVTTGDALVAVEMCRADGEVGIAYLSNVAVDAQVRLLARVLLTVCAGDAPDTSSEVSDAT